MKLALKCKFFKKSLIRFKFTLVNQNNFCSLKSEIKLNKDNLSKKKDNITMEHDSKKNQDILLSINENLGLNTTEQTSVTKAEPFKENFLSFSYKNNINYKYDLVRTFFNRYILAKQIIRFLSKVRNQTYPLP